MSFSKFQLDLTHMAEIDTGLTNQFLGKSSYLVSEGIKSLLKFLAEKKAENQTNITYIENGEKDLCIEKRDNRFIDCNLHFAISSKKTGYISSKSQKQSKIEKNL